MFNEVIAIAKDPILIILFLTLLPFLELRASIPYGILVAKQPWYFVFMLACIANIILGPIIYFFLDKMIHWFFFIKPFHIWYKRKIEKVQRKAHKVVEKYGLLGIAIFIGIPLPGSGVYTGALASYILNLGYKKFLYATIIGVLIAGIAVTAFTLTIGASGGIITKLFLKV